MEQCLEQDLRALCASLGIDECGFADVSGLNDFGYPRAVVLVVRLLSGVLEQIEDEPTYEYYSHYKAVNDLLNQASLRAAKLIEQAGYRALSIAASQSVGARENYRGAFAHKTAATRAGIGYIGKSGLFVHERYGPRVRLASILTDAPLACNAPRVVSECGSCEICVKSCPASAISGELWEAGTQRSTLYDPAACSEFMKNHFGHIGNGFVCGICMKVCPKGKN